MRDDIYVVPVFEQEAFGNHAELRKAKLFVQLQCRCVCRDDRIELQNSKADFLCFNKTIFHEKFADVLAALVFLDRIARIRNMPAAPDIVRVENVQPDHFAGVRINSDSREQ